jgi:DNA-3-methyladenine glycosylase II
MHTTQITLSPTPPFDFAQSLAFISGFPVTRGEQAIADGALTRAVAIEGSTVVFRVTAAGTVDEPRLTCTLYANTPIFDALRDAAQDRIGFFLSIDDDLAPFYAIGRGDPAFAPAIAQLYGYHHVKFLTPFENAAWAIIAQRVQMPVARKMRQALLARYGGATTVDGVEHRAFPTAERLATIDPDELLEILPTLRKAAYLHAAARAFDDVDEQWLRTAPYADVYAWLRAIPGIGEWSATFILIRGLGRMEQVSSEAALLRAAERVYGARAATPEGYAQIAATYGPYQGYWSHYLRAYT